MQREENQIKCSNRNNNNNNLSMYSKLTINLQFTSAYILRIATWYNTMYNVTMLQLYDTKMNILVETNDIFLHVYPILLLPDKNKSISMKLCVCNCKH